VPSGRSRSRRRSVSLVVLDKPLLTAPSRAPSSQWADSGRPLHRHEMQRYEGGADIHGVQQ
jgi:hypothetical protein